MKPKISMLRWANRRLALFAAVAIAVVMAAMCCYCSFHGQMESQYPKELVRIDRICDTDVDSARALWLEAKARQNVYDNESRWYLRFLSLKIKVKDNTVFADDKELLEILKHFENIGNDALLSQIYYCAGCVYRSQNDYPRAADYFMRNVDEESAAGISESIKALSCYQLGYIYNAQGLDSEALRWQSKSLEFHKQQGDSLRCVYDYENIAWSYLSLGIRDKALSVLVKARGMALRMHDGELLSEVDSHLANYYNETGSLELAKKYIDSARGRMNATTVSSVYSLSFEIYSKLGLRDSAEVFCSEVLRNGTVYAKRYAYRWLTDKSLKEGKTADACKNFQLYKECVDSVDQVSPREALARSNAMYDYGMREKANARLERQKARQSIYVMVSVAVSVILVLLLVLAYFVYQRRRQLLNVRMEILRNTMESERMQNEEAIRQKEMEIDGMQKRLKQMSDEVSLRKKELECAVYDRKNDIQRMKLNIRTKQNCDRRMIQTDVYKSLSEAILAPQDCKFADWENLYAVVNSIYPSFRNNLSKLKRMSEIQLRVCVLLRVGFSIQDVAVIVCRSQDSVYSICSRLYHRNFNAKGSSKMWVDVVKAL